MTLVKICGITNFEDARASIASGADMLGFNFYPASKRYISPESARRIIEQLPSSITCIGVFVNEASPGRVSQLAKEAGVSVVQLHGDERPAYCRAVSDYPVIKALRVGPEFVVAQVAECGAETVLLDTFQADAYGGTGHSFDWSMALAMKTLAPKLISGRWPDGGKCGRSHRSSPALCCRCMQFVGTQAGLERHGPGEGIRGRS